MSRTLFLFNLKYYYYYLRIYLFFRLNLINQMMRSAASCRKTIFKSYKEGDLQVKLQSLDKFYFFVLFFQKYTEKKSCQHCVEKCLLNAYQSYTVFIYAKNIAPELKEKSRECILKLSQEMIHFYEKNQKYKKLIEFKKRFHKDYYQLSLVS